MRTIPIPETIDFPTMVTGDPMSDDEISLCEYVLMPSMVIEGAEAKFAILELDDRDIAAIRAGKTRFSIAFDGDFGPWTVGGFF